MEHIYEIFNLFERREWTFSTCYKVIFSLDFNSTVTVIIFAVTATVLTEDTRATSSANRTIKNPVYALIWTKNQERQKDYHFVYVTTTINLVYVTSIPLFTNNHLHREISYSESMCKLTGKNYCDIDASFLIKLNHNILPNTFITCNSHRR